MKEIKPIFQTKLGRVYCADSLELMKSLPSRSVDLVITSPPYALHFKKEYGNADQDKYVEWFLPFAHEIKRILKPEGSFVLNIGGSWTPHEPKRSLYHFRLLLSLCENIGFNLAQEFFWYNPAKMPAPAEWVNVKRIRVKDSVEYIYWLSPSSFPKADNSKVLQPYSKDMERLIKRGIRQAKRPSGHNITVKFSQDRGGSIPGNLIQCGNTESNSEYIKLLKQKGKKIHPARFPSQLPRFFIKFLTNPGDLVIDPFAGSNTTGAVAEVLGRRWVAIEKDEEYAKTSLLRFHSHTNITKLKKKENSGKSTYLTQYISNSSKPAITEMKDF
jgi:site-specific DNA-methyltransferase (cytosine-N4-specific)